MHDFNKSPSDAWRLALWQTTGANDHATPGTQAQEQLETLARAIPVETRQVEDAEDAAEIMADTAPTHLLIVLVPPMVALCQAMQTGRTPTQALRRWLAQARPMLEIMRRNRGRVWLTTPPQAVATLRKIVTRMALDTDIGTAQPALPETAVTPLAPLAWLALNRHPDALSLAGEIEASIAGMTEDTSLDAFTDPDRGFAMHQAMMDHHAETLRAQQDQLQHAQSEAEGHFTEARALEDRLKDSADAHTQAMSDLQSEMLAQISTQERALFRAHEQEAIRQSEIKAKNRKLQILSRSKREIKEASEAAQEESQAKLERQKDTIRQLEQRTYQLSQGLESQQVMLDEAKTARANLTVQLAQMLDLHDDLLGEHTRAETLEHQIADLNDDVSRLEDSLRQQKKALAARDRSLETARADEARLKEGLARIERSASYRMTAPLRGLARLIGRSTTHD